MMMMMMIPALLNGRYTIENIAISCMHIRSTLYIGTVNVMCTTLQCHSYYLIVKSTLCMGGRCIHMNRNV